MKYLDQLINRVTMYRLLLYYLVALLLAAMFFGAIGTLTYSPYSIALSAAIFLSICYSVNYVFAKIYNAPSNTESSILTALILTLIVSPLTAPKDITFFGAAAGLAIASKYILAIRHKHIFNPAAIAVVLAAFGPQESASWWIGAAALAPFVIAGGLLVARKIRRNNMVFTFFGSALVSVAFFAAIGGKDVLLTLQQTLLHSSLFFLGFVMLTEPWTSPATKTKRYIYALIVGLLFSTLIHIGTIYSTPELALVIGNLAAFAMSPIMKTKLMVAKRRMYGQRTEDIELVPAQKFKYKAGQYIEMTLPHKAADSRGYRRYFTLASSPTEDNLRVGVRYYDKGSTFKEHLHSGDLNAGLSIGQLGGDFTLPDDKDVKLAFVAGGIGVTPFRSMVKYLADTNDARSVKMLYAEHSISDVAYSEIFEQARTQVGIDTKYVVAEPSAVQANNLLHGKIDAGLIKQQIPDYLDRTFYISGPQPMAQAVKDDLKTMGVPEKQVRVDYFFGYA